MARHGITYDEVKQAIQSVTEKGENITIKALRHALGDTGSLTTIQKYLAVWRSENRAQAKGAGDIPHALEQAFRTCLRTLWETSQQIAQSDIEHIRKAAQTEVQTLERDLSDACDEYDIQSAELARLREQHQALTEEHETTSLAATTLAGEKAALERRFDDVVARLEGRFSDLSQIIDKLSQGEREPHSASVPQKPGASPRGRRKKTAT